MTRLILAVSVIVALLGVGCGRDDDGLATTDTTTTTAPAETTDVRVYWLRDGKVSPALREVHKTPAVATAALEELVDGPTENERSELNFASAVSADFQEVTISDGVAQPLGIIDISHQGLAQIVYTLTQFPTVQSVEIRDRRYTRADFEDLTPAILVESPLPLEEVTSPLRVTGTANTFEANFQYELTDTDGLIIAEDFVTATSGTGTRGTFEFTVPFTIKFDGVGSLVVFEPSAKDGSRTNLVEIPIRMTQ